MADYECPYCKSHNIGAVNNFEKNQYFGLVEVIMKKPKPEIYANNVIPLNVLVCKDCSGVVLLAKPKDK